MNWLWKVYIFKIIRYIRKLKFGNMRTTNEIEHIQAVEDFDEYISVSDISSSHIEARIAEIGDRPIRLNAILIFIVERGSIQITIDYKTYTIEENSLTTVLSSHIMQWISVSADFKAKRLLLSNNFMDDIQSLYPMPPRSVEGYLFMKKNPMKILQSDTLPALLSDINILHSRILQKEHAFHKEIIYNAFITFLLDWAHIVTSFNKRGTRVKLSRKEELFEQFLDLLFIHAKKEHSVSFYADAMCITSQYLSLILKDISGKSANQWISDALITEAKTMLKTPNQTVQQVANTLHFSDQSTFGKFFKKHTGIAPSSYRKA